MSKKVHRKDSNWRIPIPLESSIEIFSNDTNNAFLVDPRQETIEQQRRMRSVDWISLIIWCSFRRSFKKDCSGCGSVTDDHQGRQSISTDGDRKTREKVKMLFFGRSPWSWATASRIDRISRWPGWKIVKCGISTNFSSIDRSMCQSTPIRLSHHR